MYKRQAQAGDASQVHRLAHSLKGTASNFCANDLTGYARSLEEQARDNNLENAQALISRIENEGPQLREFIKNQEHLKP